MRYESTTLTLLYSIWVIFSASVSFCWENHWISYKRHNNRQYTGHNYYLQQKRTLTYAIH